MEIINLLIGTPLGYLMYFCLMLVGNYGIAILLFTLLTRIILFPLSLLAQKNSIKMVKMMPALQDMQRRHAGNKALVAEEQKKLHKKERYSTVIGILPLLIQIPIILGLIAVIYNPLTHLFHLDPQLINAFVQQTMDITGMTKESMGAGAELFAMQTIQLDPEAFSALEGSSEAIQQVLALDTSFLGLDLLTVPAWLNPELTIALASALSALLLSVVQNRYNVLQANAGFLSKYGMMIFLVVFSGYFALILPASLGLYWTATNLISIPTLFLCNLIYSPKAYMTAEFKASQHKLSRQEKKQKRALDKELSKRSRIDSKRFLKSPEHKELVFYSEASGFYKYYKGLIERLLEQTDITIHYLTSDPHDQVFDLAHKRIPCYYLNDRMLISTLMRLDSDVVVMTTPDLETFHLKRSLVRKDIEYIYLDHGFGSVNLMLREHALDHFDTVFCYGPHMVEEIREIEHAYQLPQKTLVKTGLELFLELKAKARTTRAEHSYSNLETASNSNQNATSTSESTTSTPEFTSSTPESSSSNLESSSCHPERSEGSFSANSQSTSSEHRGQVLIAPSWQPDNIMESCANTLVQSLLDEGLKVIVRPHPEFVKRFPERVELLRKDYAGVSAKDFFLQDDFSDNSTLYSSDVVITDWSSIFMEFCYTTKQPALFINTPPKIANPEYQRIPLEPIDYTLREDLGASLNLDEIDTAGKVVLELISNKEHYQTSFTQFFDGLLYPIDEGMQNGTEYIAVRIAQQRLSRDGVL